MGAPVVVRVKPHSPNGYWCAGRFWPPRLTEARLEDTPSLSVEQQLAQLQHATGGQELAHNETRPGLPPEITSSLIELEIVSGAVESAPEINPDQENET